MSHRMLLIRCVSRPGLAPVCSEKAHSLQPLKVESQLQSAVCKGRSQLS